MDASDLKQHLFEELKVRIGREGDYVKNPILDRKRQQYIIVKFHAQRKEKSPTTHFSASGG